MSVSNEFIEPHYRIPLDEEPPKPLTEKRVFVISALVALVIGCVPALVTSLAIGDNLSQQQEAIQVGREEGTRTFCEKINGNTEALIAQNEFLQGLILSNVEQSKAFEKTYRNLGLPPYKERLKQAQEINQGLEDIKPTPFDCDAEVEKVREE